MPKHAFLAAGEAMPVANLNRRRVLLGTGATAAALAATSIPAEPAEHPMETARRISKELSVALDGLTGDLGGRWKAHVLPASLGSSVLTLENIDSAASVEHRMDYHLAALFSLARDEAPGAFDIYAVRDAAGDLEGFAVVNNKAGIGSLETIYRKLYRRRQEAAS